MWQLIGSSVTYCIAVGPQAGRKVLMLRTITPLSGEDPRNEQVAKAFGFHAAHPCATPLRGSLRLCKSAVLPICT